MRPKLVQHCVDGKIVYAFTAAASYASPQLQVTAVRLRWTMITQTAAFRRPPSCWRAMQRTVHRPEAGAGGPLPRGGNVLQQPKRRSSGAPNRVPSTTLRPFPTGLSGGPCSNRHLAQIYPTTVRSTPPVKHMLRVLSSDHGQLMLARGLCFPQLPKIHAWRRGADRLDVVLIILGLIGSAANGGRCD